MPSPQGLLTPSVSGAMMLVPAPASKPAGTHRQLAAGTCRGEGAQGPGVYVSVFDYVHVQMGV